MKQEESKLGDKLYVERDQTADFDDLEDSGSPIVPDSLQKEEVVDEENSFNRQKNDSIRSMGFEASDENVSPSPNQQDEDAENNPLKSVVLNSLLQRRELNLDGLYAQAGSHGRKHGQQAWHYAAASVGWEKIA